MIMTSIESELAVSIESELAVSVESELAVCFPFSLKRVPLDSRHVGLSNLHHTP